MMMQLHDLLHLDQGRVEKRGGGGSEKVPVTRAYYLGLVNCMVGCHKSIIRWIATATILRAIVIICLLLLLWIQLSGSASG
jgi:hypothetical protein